MGEEIVTLADVWPEAPAAMIVGLNPAPPSVKAGHYYQGTVGQRQLRRLSDTGLFAQPRGRYFEETALVAGIGFTDIVKRPTSGEGGVSRDELLHGTSTLNEKLQARNVPLVICVFRHPVKALLGAEGSPGLQAKRTRWGAQVFRMPGPFQEASSANTIMAELRETLEITRRNA